VICQKWRGAVDATLLNEGSERQRKREARKKIAPWVLVRKPLPVVSAALRFPAFCHFIAQSAHHIIE
jgi:hypothetical protein